MKKILSLLFATAVPAFAVPSTPINNPTLTGTLTFSQTLIGGAGVTGTGLVALSISPAFTGTPTAPTAAGGTNTTQIATTAFVQAAATGDGANPSGTISSTVGSFVNGSATTFLRSDGAPTLPATITGFTNLSSGLLTETTTALATTSTDGIIAQNTTASTAGVPVQYSPRIRWVSHAWNTTSTAADNYLEATEELRPISGSTPSAYLAWATRLSTAGSGSFTDVLRVYTDGTILTGGLTTKGTGIFQLPNHSTSAGGITLGGGLSFFTPSSGGSVAQLSGSVGGTSPVGFLVTNTNTAGVSTMRMTNDSATSITNGIDFGVAGTTSGLGFANYGYIYTGSGLAGFQFLTNGGSLALKLDNSQNAQFGGTIKSAAFTRVTADVTNATATMANLTDLTTTVVASGHYSGTIQVFANNSTGAEGLQFDLGGSSATFTDLEFGFGGSPLGATIGTATSTAKGTAITSTVVSTSDAGYTITFACTVNAGGTIIPRFAEVSHTAGTATLRKNSAMTLHSTNN